MANSYWHPVEPVEIPDAPSSSGKQSQTAPSTTGTSGGGTAAGVTSGVSQTVGATSDILNQIMAQRQAAKARKQESEDILRRTKSKAVRDVADYQFEGTRRGANLHMNSTPRG